MVLKVWVDGVQEPIFNAGRCPATSGANAAWTAYTGQLILRKISTRKPSCR